MQALPKILSLCLSLLFLIPQGIMATTASQPVSIDDDISIDGLNQLRGGQIKKACLKNSLCPKSLRLPRIANASVCCKLPKGALAYDCTTNQVVFSNGIECEFLASGCVAPTNLLVDQTAKADGVTTFNTIQSAIDSLCNKRIVNTTIQIAPGTYVENVVVQSLLNSVSSNLQILGDPRDIAGCGINHGSYWNTFNPDPSTYCTVGGSPCAFGEAGSTGNTAGNTIFTVNVNPACANPTVACATPPLNCSAPPACAIFPPNFSNCNLVVGQDKLLIRHNTGDIREYTIMGVNLNQLTLDRGLDFDANGLGAAMCIEPNVAIVPTSGTAMSIAAYVYLSGLYVNSTSGSPDEFGIGINHGSNIGLDNVLVQGDYICVGGFDAVTSGKFSLTTSVFRNFGITAFAQPGAFAALRAGEGGYCSLFIPDSLFVAGPGDAAARAAGLSEYATIDTRFIGAIICNLESRIIPNAGMIDVIVYTGSAIRLLGRGSIVENNTPPTGIRIRGESGTVANPAPGPTFGIDLEGGTVKLEFSTLSFDSVNPNACALRLGANDLGEPAWGAVSFGPVLPTDPGINIPLSTSAVVQVLNGSNLTITSVAGPITLGPDTSGFQVYDNSQLDWSAGDFIPTIATGPSLNQSILFDLQRNSLLDVTPASAGTFSGFPTIFSFQDNAQGVIYATAAQPSAAGAATAIVAQGMSRVLLGGTVTLGNGPGTTGISTSFGGFVGVNPTGTVTFAPGTTNIDPASVQQTKGQPMSAYSASYLSGTVVVS